jgi:hypothetical protein
MKMNSEVKMRARAFVLDNIYESFIFCICQKVLVFHNRWPNKLCICVSVSPVSTVFLQESAEVRNRGKTLDQPVVKLSFSLRKHYIFLHVGYMCMKKGTPQTLQ